MEPDFGGYATKADLKCSDGRVIRPKAFQHMDGQTVPLVWHHGHSDAKNVLGHALLQARPDGVYAYGFFNNSPDALAAKEAVSHGDIDSLSIYANQLQEVNKVVSHGSIREVSLVLSGANPGAKIDQVKIVHSDDEIEELDDEAVIYTGLSLQHADSDEDEDDEDDEDDDEELEHADGGPTVKDVYDSMSEEQKTVLQFMIGAALDSAGSDDAEHADNDEGFAHQEGNTMGRNVFEDAANKSDGQPKHVLSHDDLKTIFENGKKAGSLKAAVEAYADTHLQHGIESLDVLFPDAQNVTNTPEFNQRRTEWVNGVLTGVRRSPFSRIKSITADITQDAARAKGYIKGKYKVEEWFGVTKRTTGPTTIYKKQKLDRDDILDITDFDVVAWMKAEMRLMLDEEIARAILIGDGRDVSSDDKIKDPGSAADGTGIRSIMNEHELYATTLLVNVDDADSNYEEVVDAVIDGMEYYKGTGTPTFYTTIRRLNMFLKAKDNEGRRYYRNRDEVAQALGVKAIVTVEPMNDVSDLIGIIVNLDDYNVGADKGGEVNLFDDFDIDYNQQKYLMETRISGALIKIKSALVLKTTASNVTLLKPQKPGFNATTGVVVIPAQTGVVYKNADTTATLTAGNQTALAAGAELNVQASPSSASYAFNDNASDFWSFQRPAAS
jgi:phage head maturation protease